ncbi:heavy metal translocating P-type ATPase [Antarcticirhabdus aurantiaca]|uniref:Heavy metal translocating P-type ATPase n=1 Tax=Antarcticirhabdus aurantiaca TaxID=2606717 RepID=A0ACD4NRS4_9HYPH|nr:heavy metal translocating P-type ATPase [Antarcticirhabdus aurantiaca]WAJ29497.1 heavy metal translocating P-type ATPase [Jeongeuplla avenae]
MSALVDAAAPLPSPVPSPAPPRREPLDPAFLRLAPDGTRHVEFMVEDMHCAGCLARVERAAASVPGVSHARANLTTKRLSVAIDPAGAPEAVLDALEAAGRTARPFDPAALAAQNSGAEKELIRCMAVAGFASANVMLLSVSVWSGADGATRDLFHWLSAAIAVPAVIYAGRPFFRSAGRALRHFTTNMDVPIAIGVVVATLLSLYETVTSGPHAWFDGSVSLLFFLLVGRVLDERMRGVARSSAARLLSLAPDNAALLLADGRMQRLPTASLRVGDRVRILPGERVPVDGTVLAGSSDVDRSLLTGESLPEAVAAGGSVHAGSMNLTGLLEVRVDAPSGETLLAGVVRLMEAVERPNGRFVRLADRAARLYAPVVHAAALITLLGWLALGSGIHAAVTAAVAVLIITCPCALGLAVPAVQVTAAGRLLSRGIILKDGAGLEKLSEVDTVVFDKTGTLTRGRPRLAQAPDTADETVWQVAAGLAGASRHPLSLAIAEAARSRGIVPIPLDDRAELAGHGVSASLAGVPVRLGRPEWVSGEAAGRSAGTQVWLRIGEGPAHRFGFADELRPDAAETVRGLRALGLDAHLLSGDALPAVAAVAEEVRIGSATAECLPGAKVEALRDLTLAGRRVLMVGDGINDAPALAAAHVSMSPAGAADIAQAAADLVFTGERLGPVLEAIAAARATRRKILQNFVLAIGYNVVAVPIAVLGLATPLIAAVSMSASSILVVANSLALSWRALRPADGTGPTSRGDRP